MRDSNVALDIFRVVAGICVLGLAIWLFSWNRYSKSRWLPSRFAISMLMLALASLPLLILPLWHAAGLGWYVQVLAAGWVAFISFCAVTRLWFEIVCNAPRQDDGGDLLELDARALLLRDLDDARRKLRDLAEVSGDWIWQTDERGILLDVSERVRGCLGFGPEQFIGRPFLEFAGKLGDAFDMEERLLEGGETFRNVLIKCIHADGNERLIQISGSPRIDDLGRFRGYNGIGSDTTSEFRLAEMRASARAKDGFFAAMSHEIRTPLNGVLGILDILHDTALTDDQKRLVATAVSSGESLLHLINDVLDYSKIEAGRLELDPQPADLGSLIAGTIDSLSPLAMKNGTTISFVAVRGLPRFLEFDSHRYRQILVNLLGNAIKFTKDGRIRVALQQVRSSGTSLVLRTLVEDDGPGIAEDKQKHLFKEFSMLRDPTSTNTGGTGLGLSLSKTLAEAMGGGVGVKSAEGKGSTFWFDVEFIRCATLRRNDENAAGGSPGPETVPRMHILLAEDNATNAFVAMRMLTAAGHEIQHVLNGRDAVSEFASGKFDVVLMDISMPVMDGIVATREIRRQEAAGRLEPTPIVALTAHVVASEREKILSAGVSAILTKPVRKQELLLEISRHSKKRDVGNIGNSSIQQKQSTRHANPNAAPIPNTASGEKSAMRQRAGAYRNEPVIDATFLKQFAQDVGREELPRLFALFIEELKRRAIDLDRAKSTEDVELLKKTCHAISGSSSTLGARRLQRLCLMIDEACGKSLDCKYIQLIPVVQDEIALVLKHLGKPSQSKGTDQSAARRRVA